MKLVVLDAYACTSDDLSFEKFQQLAECTVYPSTPKTKIVERIKDAQLVITNKCVIDKEIIKQCPNLKYIGITATGYNIIDIQQTNQRGIVVTNVPAYSTKAVAQQVFAYLLYLCNQVEKHDRRVKRGDWQNCAYFCFYEPGLTELSQKTIGLIGFGNIAQQVAKIANTFDMKVICYTRTLHQEWENTFPYVSFLPFEEVLAKSDFISIHCPLTPQTKHLFSQKVFSQMKRTAVLINTARGPIVCEEDLAQALNQNIISYACVDVVSEEPIKGENPLLSAKNILITPHTAWAPKETRQRLLDIVYQNLEGFLTGSIQNQIQS